MKKIYHTNQGFGAVAGFAAVLILAGIVVYEFSAGPMGFPSLSHRVLNQGEPSTSEAVRHGKMLVKSDEFGNCREFGLDNRTQQVVNRGIVVCDRARQEEVKAMQKSRFDSFKDAFSRAQ
jgi:hypothetical protein